MFLSSWRYQGPTTLWVEAKAQKMHEINPESAIVHLSGWQTLEAKGRQEYKKRIQRGSLKIRALQPFTWDFQKSLLLARICLRSQKKWNRNPKRPLKSKINQKAMVSFFWDTKLTKLLQSVPRSFLKTPSTRWTYQTNRDSIPPSLGVGRGRSESQESWKIVFIDWVNHLVFHQRTRKDHVKSPDSMFFYHFKSLSLSITTV